MVAVHRHATFVRPSYFIRMIAKIFMLLILFGCAGTYESPGESHKGCSEKSCEQMTNCTEAVHAFQCGRKGLDADGDGVPCETLCEGQ